MNPVDWLSLLERAEVVAASLFGSRAAGSPRADSDADIAVWLDPSLDPVERLEVGLRLERELAELSDVPIDVVVLNDASPNIRHRALRDGRRLVDRDPRTRMRLETEALIRYLDTQPLRAELARAQDARLTEGRFGRS